MGEFLRRLDTEDGPVCTVSLPAADEAGLIDLDALPVTARILVEMQLRQAALGPAREREQAMAAVQALAGRGGPGGELLMRPTRVLCQDHSGLPVLADLAAMREHLARTGHDPALLRLAVPLDLVVDHSLEVREAGSHTALRHNMAYEYEQNAERYSFLRWAQQAFDGVRVVPPGQGIVHQVHLEHLATVVSVGRSVGLDGLRMAQPDTVLGTDSHTPMVNGLGALGWGVGGIEATCALLGQAVPLLAPDVLGVRLSGSVKAGVGAMDVALTLTEALRQRGVVGRFLEFYGPGVAALPVPDRATLANMCPEYGATAALFPVDARTLEYLRLTRSESSTPDVVARYCGEQGLFADPAADGRFREVVEFDLAAVEPCTAGPRRPQDRVPLAETAANFDALLASLKRTSVEEAARAAPHAPGEGLTDGSVVIAAITSCTNTSNSTSMVTAGLLARNAVRCGLASRPWVKTSLAPGSRVVTRYLKTAGLLAPLAELGFDVVGYGCTTCIGNSGPLKGHIQNEVRERGLAVVAVLSGNRNFEGRVHGSIVGAYLASPALVVAWALSGTVRGDLATGVLGLDAAGEPVRLADLWPDQEEVADVLRALVTSEQFTEEYSQVTQGGDAWDALPRPTGPLYPWDPGSDYFLEPPFVRSARGGARDLTGARVLVLGGHVVTTDHISPAGPVPRQSAAADFLRSRGIEDADLGSYGGRRGNHHVLLRGAFANPRFGNGLTPGLGGGWTRHQPSGDVMRVHEAAARYEAEGTPLLILAGRDYGMGSSRDWAAKGPHLLGVRVVIAQSFERIHRSNLLGMGIVPLEFGPGQDVRSLGLTGEESFDLVGLEDLQVGGEVSVTARRPGFERSFVTRGRVDSVSELRWVRHGGALPAALADLFPEDLGCLRFGREQRAPMARPGGDHRPGADGVARPRQARARR